MFGWQARIPIDLIHGTGIYSEVPVTKYATQLKQSLENAYRLVRDMFAVSQGHEQHKEHYDRKIHGEPFKEVIWSGYTQLWYLRDSRRSS